MQGNAPDEEHEDLHGECREEIIRLRDALAPFVRAWDTYALDDRMRSLSLSQLGSLATGDLSAADFQRAQRALSQLSQ
jgi:hypothetical protein